MTLFVRYILSFLVIVVASAGMAGCQQLRSDLADFISPPSELQIVARLNEAVNGGNVDQAIAAGEKFVAGSQNPNRLVHARLAELYLSQGNATQSLAHLALSNGHLQSGSSHSVTVQSRTQESVQAPQEAESPAASATIGPNGVEASAGNARASVKP